MTDAMRIETDASHAELVEAFKEMFFGKPKFLQSFGMRGTMRRQNKWAPERVDGAAAAARLVYTTNPILKKMASQNRGPGTDFVILLRVDAARSGRVTGVLALDSYTKNMFGKADQGGYLKSYSKMIQATLRDNGASCEIARL